MNSTLDVHRPGRDDQAPVSPSAIVQLIENEDFGGQQPVLHQSRQGVMGSGRIPAADIKENGETEERHHSQILDLREKREKEDPASLQLSDHFIGGELNAGRNCPLPRQSSQDGGELNAGRDCPPPTPELPRPAEM